MKKNQFARVGKILKKSLSVMDKTYPYINKSTLPSKGLSNQLPYSLPN